MKPKLYNTQRCPYARRTRIVLHEKGIDFETNQVDLANKSEEFLSASPTGKVPVIVVDGESIYESNVVNQYLDEVTDGPKLMPEDPGQRAHARIWMAFADTDFFPALSLLAARELAPRPNGPLLIVGAGTQARAHLEAFREGLGTSRVFIASRTPERAVSLADYAEDLGMEARAVETLGEALEEVSLVVTATTSREPVLPEVVPEGVFVAAVGSFEPEASELPPALISRSTVVVDTLEGAREEAGDLIQAERAGAFSWENATPLEDALRASERPGGTIVFKSVGHALWDLAAARTAFD